MNNLQEYLISIGFTPYRMEYDKKKPVKTVLENGDYIIEKTYTYTYKKCTDIHNFSSMVSGGLDVRFIKGDECFTFGLHEKGLPPTLISPRPYIKTKGFDNIIGDKVGYTTKNIRDKEMHVILQQETPEAIYKATLNDKHALSSDYIISRIPS